jgi:DNA-binding PadR family transcriptional regulator
MKCPICETEFEQKPHTRGGGRPRIFCSDHCRHISAVRKYDKTSKGLARQARVQRERRIRVPEIVAESQAKYFQSPKGKAARKKHEATPGRKAKQRLYRHTYFLTTKGQAYLERHKATWAGISKYLIYVLNQPCSVCGETNKFLLETDHILARGLGGTDDWSNLQVLCTVDHKVKTAEDLIKIKQLLQSNTVIS